MTQFYRTVIRLDLSRVEYIEAESQEQADRAAEVIGEQTDIGDCDIDAPTHDEVELVTGEDELKIARCYAYNIDWVREHNTEKEGNKAHGKE